MPTLDQRPVLVTGATGFLATHVIFHLLQAGRRVRGTVRSLARGERLRAELAKVADVSALSFVEADLDRDQGWAEAVQDCAHVLHVASPVPRTPPATPDDVIRPARNGALRVLRAAAEAGVARVVMTSSTSAVLYGHPRDGSRVYDERDWSNLTEAVGPYERSKTLAERAAWDYVAGLPCDRRLELVTLNPGLVLGPLLTDDYSVSGEVVRKLLRAETPGCPRLGWAAVDVRDVAAAHLAALEQPQAAGQRFILAIEHAEWQTIAQLLARHYAAQGFRIPTRRVPDWVLKLVAKWDETAALALPELGLRQDVSSAQARALLGFAPRSLETMVIDMADSMIARGIVAAPKSRGALGTRIPSRAH